MEHRNNFVILRKLLGAIGLSPEATDNNAISCMEMFNKMAVGLNEKV